MSGWQLFDLWDLWDMFNYPSGSVDLPALPERNKLTYGSEELTYAGQNLTYGRE